MADTPSALLPILLMDENHWIGNGLFAVSKMLRDEAPLDSSGYR